MKTRILIPVMALLLCVAMLASCQQNSETVPEIGNHFLREGVWENDLVTLTVADDQPTAPVSSIAFVFHNDSDYPVAARYQELLVEQLCDGTWTELDTSNPVREPYVEPFRCEPHTSQQKILIFSEYTSSYHMTYPPLEAGDYRMRVPCYQLDLPDGMIRYNIEFVCYFTVAPSVE